jgi:hypothetical protein
MASESLTPSELPVAAGAESDVFRWRQEQFRQLGLSEADADEFAASRADLGQARYLLGNGCPPQLALRILL